MPYFPSKEDLVFCLFSEIKANMSLHALEGYDASQPVVDRVLYLLNSLVRYSIQHPREFLLTNHLAQIPFIQERARSEQAPVLIVAFNQVMIDAQQQHLLKAMPLDVLSLLSRKASRRITWMAAAASRWERAVFGKPKERARRKPGERTACEWVPSMPERWAERARNGSAC